MQGQALGVGGHRKSCQSIKSSQQERGWGDANVQGHLAHRDSTCVQAGRAGLWTSQFIPPSLGLVWGAEMGTELPLAPRVQTGGCPHRQAQSPGPSPAPASNIPPPQHWGKQGPNPSQNQCRPAAGMPKGTGCPAPTCTIMRVLLSPLRESCSR